MLDVLVSVLTSPYIQFFILALIAGFARSDLKIPEDVTKALAMYLMLAIGLKGGISIRDSPLDFGEIAVVVGFGTALGFALPFVGYWLLSRLSKLSAIDCAAVAAHYGSVSVVTFSYATTFLGEQGLSYEGYIVTLMALMEAPAILAGLMIAAPARKREERQSGRQPTVMISRRVFREVIFNGSVVLLIGGLLIGRFANADQLASVEPYLIAPFNAVLCIFLLELGLITSRQIQKNKKVPWTLVAFGIYMPLVGMLAGVGVGSLIGLALPELFLFSVLCASASYIAVPAALRMALPEASPALYVTSSLAVTFPFNLLLGIPIYFQVCSFAAANF